MAAGHRLGRRGEDLAERHLIGLGYSVLARNYRLGRREIDLIVRSGDTIAFVEVKTRAGPGYGHPLEAITARKRREIERVARGWMQRHGNPELTYRFDALAISLYPEATPVVEHVPAAWRLGE